MYNLGQFVQYCRKPCTISLSNPFFSCTTFQVVYGVQPFVQYCTTYVQRCTKLYRLYRLYNLLYNIVTVWFADDNTYKVKQHCLTYSHIVSYCNRVTTQLQYLTIFNNIRHSIVHVLQFCTISTTSYNIKFNIGYNIVTSYCWDIVIL